MNDGKERKPGKMEIKPGTSRPWVPACAGMTEKRLSQKENPFADFFWQTRDTQLQSKGYHRPLNHDRHEILERRGWFRTTISQNLRRLRRFSATKMHRRHRNSQFCVFCASCGLQQTDSASLRLCAMILYIPVLRVFVYLLGIRPLIWADTQVRPYGLVAASQRQAFSCSFVVE